LSSLSHLAFNDVPVFAVDFVPKVLEITSRLPLLKTLVVDPNPVTDRNIDALVLPSLEALEQIAISNPNLERLVLVLDLTHTIPTLSDNRTMTHGLKSLQITQFDDPNYDPEEKFRLARNLESLFPRFEIDSSAWDEDTDEHEFWESIGQMLRFSRDSRARLLRQLEKSQTKGWP
jgi:hypothetical protein